jgi:hypothetical protein
VEPSHRIRRQRRRRKRSLGRQRHGGAPRGGVPVARDGPCLASVASRPTSATCFKAGASRRSAAPRSGGGLQSKGSGGCEKMKRCRPGAGRATRRPQRDGKAVVRVRMPRQRHPWAGLFDIVNRGRTASRRLSIPGRCRARKTARVPGAAQHTKTSLRSLRKLDCVGCAADPGPFHSVAVPDQRCTAAPHPGHVFRLSA